MSVPEQLPDSPGSSLRVSAAGEWGFTLGLAATLVWTTLCLGGYLAETMVVSSRAVWVLAVLGAALLIGRPRPLQPAAWLPVPFLLFALASVEWIAPAQWLAWREWLLWFQTWIVFFLVLHLGRSRAQTAVLAGTVVLLGLAGVALAAYQRFVDPAWMMLGRTQAAQFVGRSAGMFGIPNSLAGLLEVLLPACLVWLGARSARPTAKVALAWLAALFLFGLVLTGSRGGWIATILTLALWPVLAGSGWRRRLLGGAGVVAGLAAGLVLLYLASDQARVRIEPFLEGKFEQSRPVLWRVGLELWREAPWLGTGAASYNILFERHRPEHFRHEPDWTHNDYLNTLSDYGAVGFMLWSGAAAALMLLGWRVWRSARAGPRQKGGAWADHWRWRLGLWLGLLAYGIHLAVDFHTKIPALAWLAAMAMGLLLRPTEAEMATAPVGDRGRLASRWAALALVLIVLAAAGKADPLYRAEALRYDPRRQLDRVARGRETLENALPRALARFEQAVAIDSGNGQAWGDLAYARALSWHLGGQDLRSLGRTAGEAAKVALELCDQVSEFHVNQGIALDMEGRKAEATAAFQQALRLAPNRPEWHYHYAYHLSTFRGRSAEVLAALETCLTLDPNNAQAKALRARLIGNR